MLFKVLTAMLVVCVTLSYGMTEFDSDAVKSQKALKWPDHSIKVAISDSLYSSGSIKSASDVTSAVLKALQNWEDAANLSFEISSTERSSISPAGESGDGVSLITIGSDTENISSFSKKLANASALTRVFQDSRGSLTEADIALNPSQIFSTDQTPGTYDLEAVLTHEIGHLLGLRHSLDPSSIMFDGVPRNKEVGTAAAGRTLSFDDITKARALYGSSDPSADCCSTVRAKLEGSRDGRSIVWLQNAVEGSLLQLQEAPVAGSVEFGGLPSGQFEVLSQRSKESIVLAADSTSVISSNPGGLISIPGSKREVSFDIQLIGTGGHFSNRSVNVYPGESSRIFVAGPGLSKSDLRFGATNPKISFEATSSKQTLLSNGLPVLGFDVFVGADVRVGRYSIYAEDARGNRRYFVGAIAVR